MGVSMEAFLRQLTNILSTVRENWYRDIIDIVVLAFFVYKGIQLVRETRAWQLVKGLLFLFAVYFLANLLDLKAMRVIMQNIVTFGAVAVVIVFQPELRRVLERIGRSNFSDLGRFSQNMFEGDSDAYTVLNAIKEISAAAEIFSAEKTGALIVMERKTMLGDIVAGGTLINADTSARLLCNIFTPNTPLHDGAVIIRGGRVYAAGCFLPLAETDSLSKDLGTRHRAAVGMSENSDALIVVVSEETGTISLAENGGLTRDLTPIGLAGLLEGGLLQTKTAEHEKKPGFWGSRQK